MKAYERFLKYVSVWTTSDETSETVPSADRELVLAELLVEEMKESGFHMDDVYQGTNLTPVLNTFEGDLKDGMYLIGENNLLKSHLLNVAVQIQTDDSRMKPVKIEKRAHIDGAVSIFDALAVKMKYHKEIGRQLQNAA